MKGVSGYRRFVLRLTLVLGVVMVAALAGCLLLGAASAGDTISAFTTTAYQTTDVWLMDVSRMQFVHLQVTGQKNDIPVWSTQERRLVYYPRTP